MAEATGTIKKIDKKNIKKIEPQLTRSSSQRTSPKKGRNADSPASACPDQKHDRQNNAKAHDAAKPGITELPEGGEKR
jgi:hypothetical protein